MATKKKKVATKKRKSTILTQMTKKRDELVKQRDKLMIANDASGVKLTKLKYAVSALDDSIIKMEALTPIKAKKKAESISGLDNGPHIRNQNCHYLLSDGMCQRGSLTRDNGGPFQCPRAVNGSRCDHVRF